MATHYLPSAPSTAYPAQYAPPVTATPHIPAGTFVPGTKVQVGSHRVIIVKYLSEGGFAHVYVVKIPNSEGSHDTAVLKRVAVPDKDALANMRTEVDTMKKLKGHAHIVKYIDSHASQLKGGGYEVFLLMEYCEGGGLIDFMNTRLQDRLKEPEILKIFSDVAEGVACMHYLKPPLLHRDLKVENILISSARGTKFYKLCDFGSAAPPRPAATSAAEGRLIEDDVQRHTTLQYRSPEMVDVYRKRSIDEKSDIWALGVLLYKLCYYTTPFEEQGQMAILTASVKYPSYPVFSDKLKLLIASMLTEDPRKRPNIYQVLSQVCKMRGKEVPFNDIYSNRTASEARNNEQLPTSPQVRDAAAGVGATQAAPAAIRQVPPLDITPMRRGRPPAGSQIVNATKPEASPAPVKKDPFAALDLPSATARTAAVEELAAKFPAVDEFSILQNRKPDFQFSANSEDVPSGTAKPSTYPPRETSAHIPAKPSTLQPRSDAIFRARTVSSRRPADAPVLFNRSRPTTPPSDISVGRPKMVSHGTMTSQTSSPKPAAKPSSKVVKSPAISSRPIWRVPAESRPQSLLAESAHDVPSTRTSGIGMPSSGYRDVRGARSEKPSTENMRGSYGRESDSIHRSKSLDFRSQMADNRRVSRDDRMKETAIDQQRSHAVSSGDDPEASESAIDDTNIESNVEFLKIVEEEGGLKGQERRKSSGKRIKEVGNAAKDMLTGRFSDAFRRFENGNAGVQSSDVAEAPSEENGRFSPVRNSSSPVPSSYNGSAVDETEELSPETRREMERRKQSMEEKRVSEAAAMYRQRTTNSSGRVTAAKFSKASVIQNRVKNLLDESGRASPVRKTAEGYGKYTDLATAAAQRSVPAPSDATRDELLVSGYDSTVTSLHRAATSPANPGRIAPPKVRNPGMRPSAPPKPVALRTGGHLSRPREATSAVTNIAPRMLPDDDPAVLAEDPDSFSKRYPSLSLELVEAEISKVQSAPPRSLRIRDV